MKVLTVVTPALKEVLEESIANINVCPRTANLLENAGILTVEDLLMKKESELLAISSIGTTTRDEIYAALDDLGVGLKLPTYKRPPRMSKPKLKAVWPDRPSRCA